MPRKTPIHSTLLTAAARNILRPMGLFQKGRSRTWLDDRGWWVCVVEFQPSSWSRGSYLNVGCMWLWIEKDYISFDQGHRVAQLCSFEDDTQFESVATGLAQQAAEEVQRYRQLFTNVTSVSEFYLGRPAMNPGHWQNLHTAVACAIAGNATQSSHFFDRFLDSKWDERPEWLIAAEADAERLKALAADTPAFRQLIAQRIQRSREMHKLPALKVVDFDAPAQSA